MDKSVLYKHILNFLLAVIIITFLTGCIKPFEPEIDESVVCLNIDGSIIKGEEEQKIVISRSTSLKERKFDPVYGCTVYVIDNLGNRFDFHDTVPGIYTAKIEDAFLATGKSFQLHVIDFMERKYESDFVTIHENQPVDSLTRIFENKFTTELGTETDRYQFYIELKASESAAEFYRWIVDETWEHHSKYLLDYYFEPEDKSIISIAIRDSLFVCYDQDTTKELYLSTTMFMQKNQKKKIPLHYISLPSIKLSVKYSCMVHQYSLGEDAYNYWNHKRIDLMESGGMYTKQPSQVISNIRNIDDPDELVLGYFWASEKTQKRFYFVRSSPYDYEECELKEVNAEAIHGQVYLILDGDYGPDMTIYTASPHCFDCRKNGGTTTMPEYWDTF